MNFSQIADDAKRARNDQREAAQAVLDSANAAADLAVLRRSANTVLDLAQVMALTKADPT